jgi:hypothetical protein
MHARRTCLDGVGCRFSHHRVLSRAVYASGGHGHTYMLFKTISPGIAWSTLEVQLGTLCLKLKGDAILRLMKGNLIVLSADNYEISQVFLLIALPCFLSPGCSAGARCYQHLCEGVHTHADTHPPHTHIHTHCIVLTFILPQTVSSHSVGHVQAELVHWITLLFHELVCSYRHAIRLRVGVSFLGQQHASLSTGSNANRGQYTPTR